MLKRQKGFTLIEVLVALAIMSVIAVAFFYAMATGIKATAQANVRTTAESIAYGDMEAIKALHYATPQTVGSDGFVGSYTVTAPSNSSYVLWTLNASQTPVAKAVVSGQTVIYGIPWNLNTNLASSTDTGIQQVTITVKFNGSTIYTLLDFVS